MGEGYLPKMLAGTPTLDKGEGVPTLDWGGGDLPWASYASGGTFLAASGRTCETFNG